MPISADKIVFSILMLSIPSRFQKMVNLYNKVYSQTVNREDVEILCLIDNKSMTIPEKRNVLLHSARGKYLAYLDDDDDVSDDYVDTIVSTLKESPETDVLSFNQRSSYNGKEFNVRCRVGNPFQNLWMKPDGELGDLLRPPFHWCVWRSEIGKKYSFREIYSETGQVSEDIDWVTRMLVDVKHETNLQKTLHFWNFDSRETESTFSSGDFK